MCTRVETEGEINFLFSLVQVETLTDSISAAAGVNTRQASHRFADAQSNITAILSHGMYPLISFRKSTPSRNRQLSVHNHQLKYQVDGLVGELTF